LISGTVTCDSKCEQNSVISFLRDLTFTGSFTSYQNTSDATFQQNKISNFSDNEENMDCNVMKIEHCSDEFTNENEKFSDIDKDIENSVDENNKIYVNKIKKKHRNVNSRVTVKIRLKQFPDLIEFENNVVCKVCKVLLDWTNRGRITDHIKSQKHIARLTNKEPNSDSLTETDRIRILNQIKAGDRINNPLLCNEKPDTPVQEKLKQRLKEFPWLQKIVKLEEVECVLCRCPDGREKVM
jgi:hypothetical protein